jgi:hypothetical protein
MPIVIDDESDDDLPLFARPRATMPAKREGSSDEEPDWMKSFKSPTAKADDDDSDDGMILDIFQRKPNKTEEKFEMKSTPAKMVRSPPAGATKEANDDDKDADENDDETRRSRSTKRTTTTTTTTGPRRSPSPRPRPPRRSATNP